MKPKSLQRFHFFFLRSQIERKFSFANKKYPKGTLRGIATPPPGYEFTEDNKLVKIGEGESTP